MTVQSSGERFIGVLTLSVFEKAVTRGVILPQKGTKGTKEFSFNSFARFVAFVPFCG